MKTKLSLEGLLFGLENAATEIADAVKATYEHPAEVTVQRAVGKVQEAETTDDSTATINIFASTRDIDREGEIVMPKGIDLSQFKLSPVILEGHDYSKPPIGKAVSMTRNDYGLKMKVEFAPTDEGRKYSALARFMPLQASIGFIPTDSVSDGEPGFDKLMGDAKEWPEFKAKNRPRRFHRRSVLLETSIVPVPANPHAVQQELAKAVEEGRIATKDVGDIAKTLGIDENAEPEPPEEPIACPKCGEEIKNLKEMADHLKCFEPVPAPKPEPMPVPKGATMVSKAPKAARLVKSAAAVEADNAKKIALAVKNAIDLRMGKV
jgi:hypothetical protein